MAISVDWLARVIHVEVADLTLVSAGPPPVYSLDLDTFRRALKALEYDEDGIVFPRTHNHNTVVVLGGVSYARAVEIINGYTVTFEDGQYAVRLVGANSNVEDVTNVNQVSIRTANSGGLVLGGGSGLDATQSAQLAQVAQDTAAIRPEVQGDYPIRIDEATSELVQYETDGVTERKRWPLRDKDGNSIAMTAGQQASRGVPT